MAVLDELVGILGFDFRGKAEVTKYQKSLQKVDDKLDRLGKRAVRLAKLLAISFAARATIKSAVRFEDAIADINKVVDVTPEQLSALEKELLKMSRRLPVSADGLAAIAAEAGAAGIAFDELTGFTEAVAIAVVAFDLPAEKVGNTMAKLKNVFKFTGEDIVKFTDTVNHLSNSMAAKAGEILNFTNRAAGAAKLLGLTADELAGVGAALIASGVIPETAARGINALATRIQTDAKGVDEALQGIGLSTEKLQEALKIDGDAAIIGLFENLSKLDVSEQATALKALVGQDFSDDFSKLLNSPETLAQGIKLATDETGKLNSAQKEFAARAATTSAKWERLKGVITSIGIYIAGPLLDGFKMVADWVFMIVEAFDGVEGAAGAIKAALDSIGFDTSLAKIQEWQSAFMAGFDSLVSGIKSVVASLTGDADIGGIISGGIVAGKLAIETAAKVITTAINTITTNLTKFSENSVLTGLGDRIGTVFEKAQVVFNKLIGLFGSGEGKNAFEFIGKLIGELATLFVEIIGNNLIAVIETFVVVVDTLINVFKKLIEGDFEGAIRAVFEGIVDLIGVVATRIDSTITSILSALDRLFGFSLVEMFENIKLEFAQFLQSALAFFIAGINKVRKIVGKDAISGPTFADDIKQKATDKRLERAAAIGRLGGESVVSDIAKDRGTTVDDIIRDKIKRDREAAKKFPFLSNFNEFEKDGDGFRSTGPADFDKRGNDFKPLEFEAALEGLNKAAVAIASDTGSTGSGATTIANEFGGARTINVNAETNVTQNVTGATAAEDAGDAVNEGVKRGAMRGLAINSTGADE